MKTFFTPIIMSMVSLCILSISCQKKEEVLEEVVTPELPTPPPQYLYVTTGLCYSGNGITTFSAATASNLVLKIDTATGSRDTLLADYQAAPASAGDTPLSVVDWDEDNLLVLVGNGTSGRIETVPKNGGTRSNFGLNPGPATVLATAPRKMIKTPDGGLLILRTGFIEKLNSTGTRQGAPWVNNVLQITCSIAGGNSLLTSVVTSSSDSNRIIATHSVTGANRTISLNATGANSTSGCAGAQAAPTVSSGLPTFPVASVFDHNSGKLIIAYAANNLNAEGNSIYVYDFDEATGVISNEQKIYDASAYPGTYSYLLHGISAMALDEGTNTLYISTAISNASTVINYAIEKFNFDSTQVGVDNDSVLARVGSSPFYNYGVDTKCISSMVIGN